MNTRIIFVVSAFLFVNNILKSQKKVDNLTLISDRKLYGNLYHQHHDYFDKAFSLQGLEVGLIFNNKFTLGLYGSCFVTNLKSDINNKQQYIWLGQSGIHFGYIYNANTKIHPGFQLNSGTFWLRTDEDNFGLFQTSKAKFKLNGLVFSPQIFGELNIKATFKIRTGLSYNFYIFKDSTNIQSSDLNHISFTFALGFVCNK